MLTADYLHPQRLLFYAKEMECYFLRKIKALSFFNLKLLYSPNLEVYPFLKIFLSSCAKIKNSTSHLPLEWIAFKNSALKMLIKMDLTCKHCIKKSTSLPPGEGPRAHVRLPRAPDLWSNGHCIWKRPSLRVIITKFPLDLWLSPVWFIVSMRGRRVSLWSVARLLHVSVVKLR